MRILFSSLFSLLLRNWGKVLVMLVLIVGGAAYANSPLARERAHIAWHAALSWVGLEEASVDSSKVFWCPMHPQIKSNKQNAVCPICNMALVELEGGVVESRQYLTLTVQQIQQAGVVTRPVMRRKLYREIDTTGRIEFDERRLAKVTSWVSGKSRIEKLHINYKGVHVRKGDPLAEIYSPALIVAQQEYLAAMSALSRPAGRRLETDLLKSARMNLKHQGLTDTQIDELSKSKQPKDSIAVVAPRSGVVHMLHVQEGQYVTEGDVLFELVDLSHFWVFADIFEEEVPLVELGMPVEITLQHLPDEVFRGEIRFIDYMVKPGTRTVPIRVDVENQGHKLKAGMFARVVVRHDWPSVLAVPENAVLWSGQRAVVMVKSGDGTFEPREVELGRKWLFAVENGNTTSPTLGFGNDRVRFHEVRLGLSPGEEVVTSGAFLLNAESQFQNVLAKMLPPKSQRATLEQIVGPPIAERMRDLLDAYFRLSQSLADDKLADVPAYLSSLSAASHALEQTATESDDGRLTDDAKRFHKLVTDLSSQPPKDAHDARTRFGRISRELTTLLARHGGQTLFGKDLYQFECGMAKVGYERWLWWSPEIHNPYMGRKMLSCGKKLDVLEP